MTITVKNHYKLHLFVFSLLSLYLFFSIPVAFINRLLAIAVCLGVLLHIKEIEFNYKRWQEIIVFSLTNAYLTLAVFGFDLFLDNTYYPYLFFRAFVFGAGFVWMAYVLQSFLDVVKLLASIKSRLGPPCPTNERYWKKWLVLFSIMFPLFLLWQIAYNPIIITADSWHYLEGYYSGKYDTYRSPIYAFLINIVCHLAPTKPEVLWIAVAQNLAFSSLLATILMYFHKKWVRFAYIIPIAVVLPLIPSFGLHTIVVWTDLVCGMAMLWFVYVLARIIDETLIANNANQRQQASLCIQLCVSMVFIYFIRANSFLVYLVMTPVLALLFALKKKWKLFITIAISVVIVLLIRYPGYSALTVQSGIHTGWQGEVKYYAAIHDIQSVYYKGEDNLSPKTIAALRKYVTKLDSEGAKDEFVVDDVRYFAHEYAYDLSEMTLSEFISIYTDSFIRNPMAMMGSMLYRVRAYWVIDPKYPIKLENYHEFLPASQIGVNHQPNFLTGIMDEYNAVIAASPLAAFVWRFGVWTSLMVISAMTLFLQKRYLELLTYLPVFAYIATLCLTGGWTDYRYGLPVFFSGLFLPLVMTLSDSSDTNKPNLSRKPDNTGG
jgi:hypothetical protein